MTIFSLKPIALIAPLSLAVAASASAQSSALADVSAHLRAVTTMTASFAQTDRSGRTVNGVLTLARPGKIRFQYQKNVPILIVSDGKALTFIDYSVKQVQRWPIGNSPLGVLLDPRHDLTRFARVLDSGDPSRLLVDVRDPKKPQYGTVTLAFQRQASAPGGLMLLGWNQLDNQNNRTVIRLSGQRFNVPVSANAFYWNDPRPRGRK